MLAWQEKFHRSLKKIRLAVMGNQGGKTFAGARETAMIALGTHPFKKVRIPNIGIVVSAQGFKEGIEKTISPKFQEICGSYDIKAIKKNSQGTPNKIIWASDSVTHLMSIEQSKMVFEGTTMDYAWFDEPPTRDIFIAVQRGLMARSGLSWITATPLSQPWIYDEIFRPGVEGTDEDIEVFRGTTYENTFLPPEEIEKLKKRLTKDEIYARLHGEFQHLTGRVIKEYSPDRHFVPSFDIPSHWPVWVGIDPHRNKPNAAIFIACAPDGRMYVCNEIFHNSTIYEFGEILREISEQYLVVDYLIDTSAQEDGWNKISARQMLNEKGIRTRLAQKKNKKSSGLLLINQLFKDDRLFVMEHCKRTNRELLNYVYKQNKNDSTALTEEPEKKFDDLIDPMRYILIEAPDYSGPAKLKDKWRE